jgi:hypothetical protein
MSWAPITGTKFQDASGNLLASGTICFQPSDGNGNFIPALASSGGFIVEASQATITNGVIASYQVSPTNGEFVYTVTITDCTSGIAVVLKGVTVASAGINFDAFDPAMLLPSVPQILVTLAASPTFTGTVTAPIVNATTAFEVNGTPLGSTNLSDASSLVKTTVTINGHPLSSNVVVSASDITTGTLPHAQLPALVSADIPNNTANTTGTATSITGSITESQVTNLTTDLANRVLTSTTVNGHALSSNVVVSASDITTGTLPHAQLPALVSGDIPNNAANTTGTAGGLSANIAESQVTNLTTDLAAKVSTTTTVNGHALSSNVVVSASDITTGTLPHAQLPALLSGDIPANSANTSGTAANLSGTPALPSGTTATTQSTNDNTTKLATDAFVLGQAGTATPVMNGTAAVGSSYLYARQDHVHASDTSRVPTTTTVNGHALSSNVVVSASDLTSGNLPIAQIPTGGSSTTFLRGDSTWATPSGAGNVVAPASAAVGDYAIFNATNGQLLADGGQPTMRNRIINGDMRIDQRNAGASGTANAYTVDRWSYYGTQASKFTWQQNAGSVTPPTGFTNYLGFTTGTGYAVTSTDTFTIAQPIEGLNVADLAFGTASASTVTLSFWVRSSLTGTFGGALINGVQNRSYPFSYAIGSANTWTKITATIAGDTAGTWATNNTGGMLVTFGLGSGSNYTATSGAWTAGNYQQPTSTVSVVGTTGATWYITGVQLEAGTTATPFERRSYGLEMSLCQRYYEVIDGFTGYVNSSASLVANASYKVSKRAAPTLTLSTSSPAFAAWGGGNFSGSGSTIGAVYLGSTTGFDVNVSGFTSIGGTVISNTGGWSIIASAEL